MSYEEFKEKHPGQIPALAVIIEVGLRDLAGKDPESSGSFTREAIELARDLQALDWRLIRYIIKKDL